MKRSIALAILSLLLFAGRSGGQTVSWQQSNGPEGGALAGIFAHGSQTIFASMSTSGALFRSTNGGSTWAKSSLPDVSVLSMTTNSAGHIFAVAPLFVFRSTDAGVTWISVGPNSAITSYYFSASCVDSTGRIFAAVSWRNGEVLRSTNEGATWEVTALTPAPTYIMALAVTSSGAILAATTLGMFRTTDGGTTWVQANNGLTGANVTDVVVNQSLAFISTTGGGVYRSDNFGVNWVQMSNGLTVGAVLDLAVGTFGQLYAMTPIGVFRSVDNGNNWTQQANNGLTAPAVYLTANSSGVLFGGGNNGVYRSTDLGNNWAPINSGLRGVNVRALAISPNGYVYAGAQGIHRSSDFGNTWTQLGLQNTMVHSIAVSQTSTVYAGAASGVFRSTNNGSSWQATVVTGNSVVAAGQGGTAFAGNNLGVFRSTDYGVTWDSVNTGLPHNGFRSIAVSSIGYVYAATSSSGLYRSTNNGANWTHMSLNKDAVTLFCLSPGTIFAGAYGTGVSRSTDHGATWNDVLGGTGYYSTSFTTNTAGRIFASFDTRGVYQSTDGGNNWTAVNQGLTTDYVGAVLAVLPGSILAGTRHGVYLGTPITLPAPAATFSSKLLTFSGGVKVGLYRDTTVSITNTGIDTLKILSISSSTPAFSARPTSKSVPPGLSFVDTIRFSPTTVGVLSASIVVSSNAPTSPDTIKVSGVGQGQASLILDASSLLFGSAYVGQFKDAWVTCSNNGNDTLKILSITSSEAAFSAHPTSKAVPPGLAFLDTIRFAPVAAGPSSARLLITSNALTSPDTLRVSGIGVRAGPAILSLSTLWFGNVTVGQYKDTIMTISNGGSDTLMILSITSSDVALSARPSSKKVPANTSFVDTIRFAPTTAGAFSAYLLITSNAPSSPDTVRVTGTALPFATGVAESGLPTSFNLGQNYPNPFNPSTTISYAVPKTAIVSLRIFNTLGQVVAILVDGMKEAGYYRIAWHAADAPSGVYFYRMQVENFVETNRMVLLR